MATDNAPIYIAVTQAKKRAVKPPIAAKKMRRETIMALTVAARKKSIKTSNPVNVRRVIVPTCRSFQNITMVKFCEVMYKQDLFIFDTI